MNEIITPKQYSQKLKNQIKYYFDYLFIKPFWSGLIGFAVLFTGLILTKIFISIFSPLYILNVGLSDFYIASFGFIVLFAIRLLLNLRRIIELNNKIY